MKVNVRNPRDVHFWYDTEGGTHLSYTTVDPPPRQIPIYSMMEGGATWPEYTLHEHYQRLEIIAAENIGGANLFNRSLEFQPDDAQEWLDSIRYNPDTDIWCLD